MKTLKKNKINQGYNKEIFALPCSLQACFTKAKMWKQPKVPSVGEWIKKCDVYIQMIIQL